MLRIADLVGHPYRPGGRDPDGGGLDCWGLVRVVLGRLGVTLPLYADTLWDSPADSERAAAVALGEAEAAWTQVEPAACRPGDVALLRIDGLPVHVGVIIGWPDFLHAHKAAGAAVIDRLTSPQWRHRLVAVYRHPGVRL